MHGVFLVQDLNIFCSVLQFVGAYKVEKLLLGCTQFRIHKTS